MTWLWFALGFGACALLVAIAAGIERDRTARLQRLEQIVHKLEPLSLDAIAAVTSQSVGKLVWTSLADRPQTVSVLLIGECNDGPAFASMTVALRSDEVRKLFFAPQLEVNAGAWLVCVGPALISSVGVGTLVQAVTVPSHGPVVLLRDKIQIAQHLHFELQLAHPNEGALPRSGYFG